MSTSRARRVAAVLLVSVTAACHGATANDATASSSASGKVDVKAACAALSNLRGSASQLDGVEVADPGASLAALTRAVDAYSAALQTFEQVGPSDLRAGAEAVRSAVVARNFVRAAAERSAIDAWATQHCSG